MILAERLARHPSVTLTRYPGLASHPTHEAARRQLKGFGTIISFDVRGDDAVADAVHSFAVTFSDSLAGSRPNAERLAFTLRMPDRTDMRSIMR
jgi:cystathionine beta-lyase/cystathionine gamma-synthase